jgi:hypothetical protein
VGYSVLGLDPNYRDRFLVVFLSPSLQIVVLYFTVRPCSLLFISFYIYHSVILSAVMKTLNKFKTEQEETHDIIPKLKDYTDEWCDGR